MKRRRDLKALVALLAAVACVAACSSPSGGRPTTKASTNGPLLVSQRVPATAQHEAGGRLALLDVRSRAIKGLTPVDVQPTAGVISGDGTHIAYVAVTASRLKPRVYQQHGTVHITDVAGAGDQPVFRCHEVCTALAWSPSGMQLVAAEDDGIVVIDLNGGSHKVCGSVCGTRLSQPAWSPDGSTIAFVQETTLGRSRSFGSVAYQVDAIWTVGSDGSDLTKLTDRECSLASIDACTLDSSPSWAPDGSLIAISRAPAVRSQVGSHGPGGSAQAGEITLIDPDGTGTTRVIGCGRETCTSSRPAWSPDGSHLAFIDGGAAVGGPGQVTVAAIPAGTSVTMPTPQHTRNTYFSAVAWSPDSRQLAMLLSHGYHSRVLIGRANGADLTELSVPDIRGWDDATFAWAAKP
jgi:Tol biopolymer transport system component